MAAPPVACRYFPTRSRTCCAPRRSPPPGSARRASARWRRSTARRCRRSSGGTLPRVGVGVDHVAARVDGDDLLPRDAAKVLVVLVLDAGLPHERGRRQRLQRRIGLHLLGRDRSDVAEDLRGDVALRVGTDGLLLRGARRGTGRRARRCRRSCRWARPRRSGRPDTARTAGCSSGARASARTRAAPATSRNIVASVWSPSTWRFTRTTFVARSPTRTLPWLSRICPGSAWSGRAGPGSPGPAARSSARRAPGGTTAGW